jgi:tetratricopeptide (TPR) repeat protein
VKIWIEDAYTLERGHVDLAEYYERTGQYRKAFREYNSLIALTPYNVSPYLRAADALLKVQALQEALPLLYQSLQIEETPFAHKWIGQILLGKNQLEPALQHLETAYKRMSSDPQLLYNLAGAYTLNQQYYQAKAILDKLLRVSPTFPGAQLLSGQVNRLLEQQDT